MIYRRLNKYKIFKVDLLSGAINFFRELDPYLSQYSGCAREGFSENFLFMLGLNGANRSRRGLAAAFQHSLSPAFLVFRDEKWFHLISGIQDFELFHLGLQPVHDGSQNFPTS